MNYEPTQSSVIIGFQQLFNTTMWYHTEHLSSSYCISVSLPVNELINPNILFTTVYSEKPCLFHTSNSKEVVTI